MVPSAVPLRPLSARITFLLFALVLALNFHFATVGWRLGMLPGVETRQAQTGLSTYFIQRDHDFSLAYPTPVLGQPWSVPMEFPLYQWSVAALNTATGGPLVVSARTVSLFCFYLGLPALWLLLRELGVDPARRWLALVFVPACPAYIFYARSFLIEPMALALALWFLAALTAGLRRFDWRWLGVATVAGTGAGLTKVTTAMLVLAPIGFALAWQLWIALRGPGADRPTAWRRLRLAALTLALPFALGAAWIVYSDSIKVLNASGADLTSARLREYHFGHLAHRFSPDAWRKWAHYTFLLVVPPAVLGGLALAALFGPRRWRWLIAASVALYAAGPAIFPNLYAWHEYYYYANAVFLALAAGVAAVSLVDSRLPRWVAWPLVAAALGSHFQLYRHEYLPQQRLISEGGSGLTQMLADLTDRDDVLVIAGKDWDSVIPYFARRRALMVRRDLEQNPIYLERAFRDLRGTFPAVLILTGDSRGNRPLLDLAVARLGIHPAPFLDQDDATVYVHRDLRDEWSVRVQSSNYSRVRVRPRSDSPRPLLAGSSADVHGKGVFSVFRPIPTRFDVPYGLTTWPGAGHPLFNAHATSHFWFDLPPGHHRLRLEFGMLDSAWQNPADHTDGVEFVLAADPAPDAKAPPLWHRLLEPATVTTDRGLQTLELSFDLPAAARLQLSILPGRHGSNAFDWAYVSDCRVD